MSAANLASTASTGTAPRSDTTVLGFSLDSTEFGRQVGSKFNRLLLDLALSHAASGGREVVTPDDVEACVADAARTLAAEFDRAD